MTAQPGIPQHGTPETTSARATPEPDPTPVGTMLREARLRRGLTLAEAAADTRINPAYLEAIESERWELMPAPVYARGFFRAYARYLGVPHEEAESVVPRNLPRPRDLEPVAGLRRRGAEAPLSLPSLPSLRLPTLALRRRTRRAPQSGDRLAPAGRAPRTSAAGTGSLGALTARTRRAGSGLAGAQRSLRSRGALDGGRGLEALRRIDARTAYIGTGALVIALLLVLVYVRPGGGGTEPTGVVGTSGGQVAGPEPTIAAAPPGSAPAPFKEGEMPDLAGLSRNDAEDTLSGLGLTFVVIEVANDKAASGSVFGHSPGAGKSVKRGDVVSLLIARAP